MAFLNFLKPLKLNAPEITYFNHLVGEFESLETIQAPKPPAGMPPAAEAPTRVPPTRVPPAGVPPAGVSSAGVSSAGEAPTAEAPTAEAPTAEAPTAEAPAAVPPAGVPPAAVSSAGVPPAGVPPAGVSSAGEAPTGVPPAGVPPVAEPPATSPSDAAATAQRMIAEIGKKVEDLKAKRDNETIDWNDLYLLEMLLAEVRPVGALRSKVLSLRRDYRSIAGQVEYDEYLASKPKNLLDPPDPRNPPDKDADYERLLRDDLKDVLGRLFNRYAILPIREARLKRLTIYASLLCGVFLAILILIIVSMDGDPQKAKPHRGLSAAERSNVAHEAAGSSSVDGGRIVDGTRRTEDERNRLPSIALFVVLVSGAMGGFVSALQRIQSSPTEGDSVYNLALLYHSSYAVFVAPLTGAIFGILLYMMFTGKILEGRFFPNIYTPKATTAANTNATADTNVTSGTGATTDAATGTSVTSDSDAATGTNVTSDTDAATSTNVTSDTDATTTDTDAATGTDATTGAEPSGEAPTASLGVKSFLYQSGPAGGQDYALLIIWSFIAGFAERFVPDSLNRLISNKSK